MKGRTMQGIKNFVGAVVIAVAFFAALILGQLGWGLLSGDDVSPTARVNNVVIASRTPAGVIAVTDTLIPLPTDTLIPFPTSTLIPSDNGRIDELFLGVRGVTDVEVAVERNDDDRISGVAIVTIAPEANLYAVRDNIWTNWVYHAQRTFSYEKTLFIDLTITQNGIQSVWQKTSGMNSWVQVSGTVPTVQALGTIETPIPNRPSNCDEARAMGMTAEQAADAGLDRDGDGVACYGD